MCTITVELLHTGGETVVTWLINIVNHAWSTEQISDDWRKGITLPFCKRKGAALTCSHHRGITLLSIPGKTCNRAVINRAIPAMHHHRRPHQAGFSRLANHQRITSPPFDCSLKRSANSEKKTCTLHTLH